jgi:cytochrome P450
MDDTEKLALRFDHHSVEQMQDPYRLFAQIRTGSRVGHSEVYGGFYFPTTYDAIKQVFSDFRTFTSTQGTALPLQPVTMLPIDLDPPQHTHFRKLLNPFFTIEAAARDRPRIEGIVERLIDKFVDRGSAELASELTRPTLAATMLPIIGVPTEDQPMLADALEYLAHYRTVDPAGSVERNVLVATYLTALAAKRRQSPPREDLLQSLIENPVGGRLLSDEEIFRVLLLTLFGALDTTHSALSEAIVHLALHGEDRARLIDGAVPWTVAIEEFLRFASPIQVLRRTVVSDVEIDGCPMSKGDVVLALNGAANRDPAHFPNPDACIIDRDPRDHLAFGAGAHICLGRNYARAMMDVVLKALLKRIPDYRLADDFVPEYSAGEARGLRKLPIAFTPGRTPSMPRLP